MVSFYDHTLVLFPPLRRAYWAPDVLTSITRHIDYTKSGILLDNTTLFTTYKVLVQETSGHVLPHYLLDIGVLATAVSFFDRVYFLNADVQRQEWHDFFIEYIKDRDEQVLVEIPVQPRKENDPLHRHFESLFEAIPVFYHENPKAAEGYQDGWEKILGVRPSTPSLKTVRPLLNTPKHPLQQLADALIERGYIERGMDGKELSIELDEYCVLSSSKALFYSALARELDIPYLANSLRGASFLAHPLISSADENLTLLEMNLELLRRIRKQVGDEIEDLELVREFTRIPLALSALFNHKLENPQETLLDCLLWLRGYTKGYRSSIAKYLAVVKGESCGIIEAELAAATLKEDFSKLPKYISRGGLILKLAGTVLKASVKPEPIGILFEILSQIATGEDSARLFLRFYRPYLYTALSLKDAAKECLDLSPVYSKVFGRPYPDRFLRLFERLTEFRPAAGF